MGPAHLRQDLSCNLVCSISRSPPVYKASNRSDDLLYPHSTARFCWSALPFSPTPPSFCPSLPSISRIPTSAAPSLPRSGTSPLCRNNTLPFGLEPLMFLISPLRHISPAFTKCGILESPTQRQRSGFYQFTTAPDIFQGADRYRSSKKTHLPQYGILAAAGAPAINDRDRTNCIYGGWIFCGVYCFHSAPLGIPPARCPCSVRANFCSNNTSTPRRPARRTIQHPELQYDMPSTLDFGRRFPPPGILRPRFKIASANLE
ncbi:hypothetical protein C8J57DRAFT_174440 [Mycena rebaudengoi]|nr:hypothetical protein C8J57DRAFT_174440 [Mycena rebaudengoi]